MNRSCLVVHHEISDEAAAQLSEPLNDLAFAFDGRYFVQIRRYYVERRENERCCQGGQLELFVDHDVTF